MGSLRIRIVVSENHKQCVIWEQGDGTLVVGRASIIESHVEFLIIPWVDEITATHVNERHVFWERWCRL